jgi:medium-chain acyl-[acyl-carrier-protein] hydrolase
MEITTPYINLKGNIDNDTYKLICIPCAGYGASFYNDWQEMIGPEITILPIQLPGHENRICEPLIHNCCELASLIADEISKYVYKGKFSLLGHSMGGILAYEVSKDLQILDIRPIFALFHQQA